MTVIIFSNPKFQSPSHFSETVRYGSPPQHPISGSDFCISDFSLAVIKHNDHRNLVKMEGIWTQWSRGIRVHHCFKYMVFMYKITKEYTVKNAIEKSTNGWLFIFIFIYLFLTPSSRKCFPTQENKFIPSEWDYLG